MLIHGEIVFNYAASDWNIENVDNDEVTKYNDLNIGGVSIKVGLAFRF